MEDRDKLTPLGKELADEISRVVNGMKAGIPLEELAKVRTVKRAEIVKAELKCCLPLALPTSFPCPICGSKVVLTHVTEWGCNQGDIVSAEYDCETEPDIDSDEWQEWFAGHFAMPYVDWLPWENRMLAWLNRHYKYTG